MNNNPAISMGKKTVEKRAVLRPRIVARIVEILGDTYGNPRHGNKKNPLDELIYIILSTRTQQRSFQRGFAQLKRAYPSWNQIGIGDRARIRTLLKSNGLARLKTEQILSIVDRLRRGFGRATLSPLRGMSDDKAEEFLTQLPGVSLKVAKCVLMYSLDRAVLPVDVHVHRLAFRFGFPVKRRPDTSQHLIESAVPPRFRYAFHVNAIAHGRKLCTQRNPGCGCCPISGYCQFLKSQPHESQ